MKYLDIYLLFVWLVKISKYDSSPPNKTDYFDRIVGLFFFIKNS